MLTAEATVAAVVEHGSISAAAKSLGVSRSTVHRRLAKPDAQDLIGAVRDGVRAEVAVHLARTAVGCLETLTELLRDGDARIRLRAASQLLSLVGEPCGLRRAPEDPAETPADRAKALARAQCSDEEIAAVIAVEFGEPFDLEAHRPAVTEARFHGQAVLRERLFRNASPTMASWLSRQHLGMSPRGVDVEIREVTTQLLRLSPTEQARKLREAADKLDSGTWPLGRPRK